MAPFAVSPVIDGATLRVSELLRELARTWKIRLVAPQTDSGAEADLRELGLSAFVPVRLGEAVTYLPFQYDTRPLIDAVRGELDRQRPTAVLLWWGSQFLALEMPDLPPVVADRVDSVSLIAWRALRNWQGGRRWLGRLNTFRSTLLYERQVAGAAYATVVVGEDDARWLRRVARTRNVHVIPNGVRLADNRSTAQKSRTPTVVFTGVMAYEPNIDAARYFAREVWPQVRARMSSARFVVAGRSPTAEVLRLAEMEGVEVLGEVPDMASLLARSWLAVAPMRRGSGIKNKVLEAWAAGTPVVMTSLATNGIEAASGFTDLVADDPKSMARVVLRLLEDRETRERLGGRAYEAARAQSWEEAARKVSDLLAEAVARSGAAS